MIRIRRGAGATTFALLLVLGLQAPAFAQVPEPPTSIDADVPFTAVDTAYAEDFELDDGGWTTSEVPPPEPRPAPINPDWEWGVPTSGPGEAVSGANVWALNLEGPYRVPQCAAIMSPPIDLTAAGSASVAFQHWVHMDSGSFIAFHGGLLMVTTDGGETLTTVTPQNGYPSVGLGLSARRCLNGSPTGQQGYSGGPSGAYEGASVNLDAFAGQQIQFVLAFGTDSVGSDFNGWYMDDFAVTVDGVTTVEDFESSDGGFTVVSTAVPGEPQQGWSWGQPSGGPDHVGNVWATNLGGDHGHGECHWVETEPFQLSSVPEAVGDELAGTPVTTAQLSWLQFFRTSSFIGQGVVQVGTSDGNYTTVTPVDGYDRAVHSELADCLGSDTDVYAGFRDSVGDPMRVERADLTEWLGEEITIRFLFASRSTGTTNPGWYVDDLKVELGVGASARVGIPATPGGAEAPFTRVTTLYAEDFEATDGGWSQTGTGEWDWGTPVSPPNPVPGELNLWGTQTRGSYGTEACSYVTSPPIDLPGASADVPGEITRMEFDLFVDATNRHDGAILEVSTDGGATWEYITPNEGYDAPLFSFSGAESLECLGLTSTQDVWTGTNADPDGWRRVSVDLTPFMGNQILVRFGFGSNDTAEDASGVYVDRVVVAAGVRADTTPPDPSQLGIVAPGWEVTGTNPSWLYGLPTSGPQSLLPVWATGLHGPYNRSECSAIVSRPVDTSLIPGLGRLELDFQHYFNTTSTLHAGVVQVSADDGATWTTVTPTDGYPVSLSSTPEACLTPGVSTTRGYAGGVNAAYEDVTVDLRQFEGQTIRVRFAFSSSTSTPGDGWYVRSIGLNRGAGSVPLGLASEGLGGPFSSMRADAQRAFLDAADADLERLVKQDATRELDVILTGPQHEGIADVDFDTRAGWMSWFDAQSAGFFAEVDAALASLGGQVLGRWSAVPAVKVRAPASTIAAIPYLTGTPDIAQDQDDFFRVIEPIEGSEFSAANSQGRNMIEAEDIWALGYRGEGVKVSIVDTGIDGTHEAFKNADGTSRISAFANCAGVSGCIVGAPFDDHGHGTHVGGTAAGSDLYDDPAHGSFQEVGVAPRAEIIAAKFLSSSGGGSLADALDALQWSFDQGADLTSNSWGGGCTSGANSVLTMVNNQAVAGMVTVAANGNNGSSPVSPACAKHAIAVGAVDGNEVIAPFSNPGPCRDPSEGNFERICPDLVAKGVDVRSSIPRSGASFADPSGYRVWSGTSMATPHIAGAVVLSEQMKRAFTGTGWDTSANAEREVLTMTAKPLGSPSPNNDYGYGLPKLLSVYALLSNQDNADIHSTFTVNPEEVWLGDTANLAFSVRNLGGAIATGDFLATLTDPNGQVTTLKESNVSLGLLDGESMNHAVTVTGDVLPGTYTFDGSFAYSWTDGDGNVVEDLVEHTGQFTVFRVFVDLAIDGYDEQTTLLDIQEVTVGLENTGNDDGQNAVLEFTVPDAYEFLPSDPLLLLDGNARYSDPPPSRIVRDEHFGRTTLIYEIGSLPVGETFQVNLNLLPMETGTHWVRAVAKFQDGAGTGGLQSKTVGQTVELI